MRCPAQAIRRPINVVTRGSKSSPSAEVLLRLRRESNEVAVSTLSRETGGYPLSRRARARRNGPLTLQITEIQQPKKLAFRLPLEDICTTTNEKTARERERESFNAYGMDSANCIYISFYSIALRVSVLR